MARPLEQAVAAIVCTFQEYSGRCGDKHRLCQAELKELLQKELPTWTPVSTWAASLQGGTAWSLQTELGTSSEQVGYRRGCEEGTPEREWTWQEARCPHLREQKESRHTCWHAGLLGGRMAAHSRHSASSGRAQGHGHGRMTRTGRLRLAPRRAQEAWTAQEGRVGRGTLPPQPAPPPPLHRRSCESVTTINS